MRPRKELGELNKVGATITKLRKEKRWKQYELLAKLQVKDINISPTTLSEIEGQRRGVKYEELKAFSEIFGVPIEALFEQEN